MIQIIMKNIIATIVVKTYISIQKEKANKAICTSYVITELAK